MNKKQLAEAITKAEAELARLQAIVPDPEEPLMVLSAERVPHSSRYHIIIFSGVVSDTVEVDTNADRLAYANGAYYSSKEQAEAYARAFRTMRLIRRQPGVVPGNTQSTKYRTVLDFEGNLYIKEICGKVFPSFCVFPCFESLKAAEQPTFPVAVVSDVLSSLQQAGWPKGTKKP